ncbi:MAG: OB-fold nucleic acid binding domain-containing protein, partial [Bacteroidota bacterium]
MKVCGWVHVRRDHGKITFIDLRDRSGILQCVITPDKKEAAEKGKTLRSEFVVEIEGKIKERPEKLVNPNIATG